MAELGEGDDLGVALGAIGEERTEFGGDVLGGEMVLEKLWDNAAASDEVGHGDGQVADSVGHVRELVGVPDETFDECEGEGRDAVDDDKRVSHNCSEDGGRATRNNGGPGVVERLSSVGHKS